MVLLRDHKVVCSLIQSVYKVQNEQSSLFLSFFILLHVAEVYETSMSKEKRLRIWDAIFLKNL